MGALPVKSFNLRFYGNGNTMIFQVKEVKRSRALQDTYELVYSVIVNPHNDTDMGIHLAYIGAEHPSDEIIIAWNVWNNVGDTFYDKTLVKKWPPHCTRLGVNQYEVTIKYAPLFIVDFNINPLRTKILQSRRTTAVWEMNDGMSTYDRIFEELQSAEEKTGYSYINIDDKGNVDGTDVLDPMMTWTERWTFGPYDGMTFTHPNEHVVGYINNLLKLSCTLNDNKFRGFNRGEVLFRSVSGRHTGPLAYEIDYTFSARPNKGSLEFGDLVISLFTGKWFTSGWVHVDVDKFTNKEATLRDGRKVILPIPYTVRIHEIYKYSDFGEMKTYPDIILDSSRQLGDNPFIPTIGGRATLATQITAGVTDIVA